MISNADLHRWFTEHGGQPDLVVDPDGTRTAPSEVVPYYVEATDGD